jgi:hypothetical protein
MCDWIQEEDFRSALLLWIVDDTTPWRTIAFAIHNKIPFLAPESNLQMKQLCIEGQCGLYYADAAEAYICLELMLTDGMLRARLGENGQTYALAHPRALRPITA